MEAQAFSVKRAQVEFHNFASLGEPERAKLVYHEENIRRGAMIRNHLHFTGPLGPFLEIGANAGHTSYLLANEFGVDGYALDISADSLRYGIALQAEWGMERAPIRMAGDALHLPFRDGSLGCVLAFQMLSQFMDIEAVFLEVKRVLAPGGVFIFAEEPLRRLLTLGLYRAPYWDTMKPWERKLYQWGLLGYLVQDVIGAHQEESFGIRQNHRMNLADWHALVQKHFVAHEYEIFVPERGWGESIAKKILIKTDPHGSVWRAARLLGGTLAAFLKKEGTRPDNLQTAEHFEACLQCPDCQSSLRIDAQEILHCTKCPYAAPNEGGVYNLLGSADKKELYPGDRQDVIDFSLPGHASKLLTGFYDLEGVYGNKYRWIAARAEALLTRVHPGPQKLRIRAHTHEKLFAQGAQPQIEVLANGVRVGNWELDRTGLLILEGDLPDADEYKIQINASPVWEPAGDARPLTVTISMLRLIPQ